ncbi:MAG: RluA family pseudouridine synthase [Planctomycetota bacterium]|jgi:23S rRNA pseudouridine1911/1915/1917 synthase
MIPRFPGDPPLDLSRPLEEVRIRIDKPLDGARLDRALVQYLTWRSRNSIHQLIKDGYVLLEGRRARPATKVRRGEVLRIKIPKRPEPQPQVTPDDSDIRVLHEDRYMIAVDKPPGLAVHPAGRRVHGTLIHFLHTRYRRPEDPEHDVVPRLLHRIDRETSGVVVASLHEDFHSQVARQFEDRKVQKTYLAIVHGCPEPPAGLIDLGIGPDKDSSIRLRLKAHRDGSGQPALTRYRVVRRNARFALVEMVPKTGRTHQLRVHMAALGCPLVGDKVYGADDSVFLEYLDGQISDASRQHLVLERHALHNHSLRFHHPYEEREMVIAAPLPPDMAALVPEE